MTPFLSVGIPGHDGELRLARRELVCFPAPFAVCEYEGRAFLSEAASARDLFLFSREPERGGWHAVLCLPVEMSRGKS